MAQPRPKQHAPVNGVIQRVKALVPYGQQLSGGNGVSVIWDEGVGKAHVTIAHGQKDSDGYIDVGNIHYKTAGGDYFHWDANGNSTTLKFRSDVTSLKVFRRTEQCARRFGLTLEKPPSIVVAEQEEAAAEQARVHAAAQARIAQQEERAAAAARARQEEEAELNFQAQQAAAAMPIAAVANQEPVPDNWDD
jgi:hypothetical protein